MFGTLIHNYILKCEYNKNYLYSVTEKTQKKEQSIQFWLENCIIWTGTMTKKITHPFSCTISP